MTNLNHQSSQEMCIIIRYNEQTGSMAEPIADEGITSF